MASQLNDFSIEPYKPQPRPFKYPWDKWLDGQVWRIEQGIDFPGSTIGMVVYLRRRAKLRGGRVELRHQPPYIEFRFKK
jgi:hypothetical protein